MKSLKYLIVVVTILLVSLYTYRYYTQSTTPRTTNVVPHNVSVSGLYTCLPKINTGGPVTLECALGLVAGSYAYAIDMSKVTNESYPMLTGNETITVEGMLTPKEMLSAAHWQSYDIEGVISVERLTVDQ